jgi:TM2 domain-containing membrane protein YozV
MGGMGQLQTKKFPKQRHFLAVFFLSFMWGTFGVDRMYLGKWGTGILKLITLGGCGLWTIIDLIIIMSGAMRDKQGREMLQFAEYKAFASKMVLIFAVVLGTAVLLNGLFLLAVVMQFMTDFQNGTLPSIDGFNSFRSLSPAERFELGL